MSSLLFVVGLFVSTGLLMLAVGGVLTLLGKLIIKLGNPGQLVHENKDPGQGYYNTPPSG